METEFKNIYPLFSTPLYHINIKNYLNDAINLNDINWDFFYKSDKQKNTYVSKNQNVLLLKEYKTCKKIINFAMKEFLYEELKISPKVKPSLASSWIFMGLPGSTTSGHMHVNSMYSGVFYLKSEKGAGNINFLANPIIPSYTPHTIRLEATEYNIFNSLNWEVELETNDIVIFPSHLHHQVSENMSNEIRCGIAFNYMVTGEISDVSTRVLKL